MHITNNALTNAAAMTAAMPITDKLLEAWGAGCVELYHAIGEWAAIVTEEENLFSEALDVHEEGWPGVFAYEVTEEVGRLIRIEVLQGGCPDAKKVREWTREAIAEFCNGNWGGEVLKTYLTTSKAAGE